MTIRDLKYVLDNADELRQRLHESEQVFGNYPDWEEAPWSVVLIDCHPQPPTEEEIDWVKGLEKKFCPVGV